MSDDGFEKLSDRKMMSTECAMNNAIIAAAVFPFWHEVDGEVVVVASSHGLFFSVICLYLYLIP